MFLLFYYTHRSDGGVLQDLIMSVGLVGHRQSFDKVCVPDEIGMEARVFLPSSVLLLDPEPIKLLALLGNPRLAVPFFCLESALRVRRMEI